MPRREESHSALPVAVPAASLTVADTPRFLIADVAARTGVPPSRLRSWEQAGLLQPRRSSGAVRLYKSDDVARVRLIKRSLVNPGRRGSLRRLAARLASGELRPEPQDYAGLEESPVPGSAHVSDDPQADLTAWVPWRNVVESLADLVAICDERGVLIYLNPALQAVLGQTPAVERRPGWPTATGANGTAGTLFGTGDLSLYWTARTGVAQRDIPLALRGADGTERRTLWHVTPLRDDRGALRGAVAVGRDVTAARDAVQEDWLAIAVHDLHSPLTAILGNLQLARRATAAGAGLPDGSGVPAEATPAPLARLARHLDVAETGARDLIRSLDTLLDASAAAAGGLIRWLEPEGVDLGALARQAVEHVQRRTTRHPITLQLPQEAMVVAGDRARLRQVLDNLLDNAVKYAPDGGPITVRLERVDALPTPLAAPARAIAARRDTPAWALLRVADVGLGIPAADVPHVFERYRRAGGAARLIRGMGLGLYACRAIVAVHGGHIWVERTAVTADPGDRPPGTSCGLETAAWHGTVMAVALPLPSPAGAAGAADEEDQGSVEDLAGRMGDGR